MSVYPARTPSTLNTSPQTAETMIEARQRIAQLGASLVRHRISPRNVGLNRHFLRGLVAVLSPSARRGHRPGVFNRARGHPSLQEFLPAICRFFRGASSIGSPTPSAGGARKHGGPSVACSLRRHLGTTRCAVGPR